MSLDRKLLMTSSAIFFIVIGFLFLFLPEEILRYLKIEAGQLEIVLFQLLSALYLGFGVLNWMSRSALIGGIYKRPVVLANLTNFWIGAITLIKLIVNAPLQSITLLLLTIIYVVFTILFFIVFRSNPKEVTKNRS